MPMGFVEPSGFAAGTTRLGPSDAGEAFTLQLAAWVSEGRAHDTLRIPPLQEELADVVAALADPSLTAWGYRARDADVAAGAGPTGRLLAMARTSLRDGGRTAFVGRLGVVPDLRGRGYGAAMLAVAEARVADTVERYELVTGDRSYGNHGFYRRHGYELVTGAEGPPGTVTFGKIRPERPTSAGSGR